MFYVFPSLFSFQCVKMFGSFRWRNAMQKIHRNHRILGVIPCTQRKSACVALKNKFSDAILHISKKKLNALFIWSKKTFLRFCGTLITSNRWFLWLDRASLKLFFSDSIRQKFTGFMI